jgi:hypothetical protein
MYVELQDLAVLANRGQALGKTTATGQGHVIKGKGNLYNLRFI